MVNTSDLAQSNRHAWLVIIGASTSLFCTVGFMNSFGVFEEVYAADKQHNGLFLANGNQSTIGWLGAIAILFLFGSSPIAGAAMDAFGPKLLTCIGALGMVFSLMMISLCKEFWQFILAQGMLLGISMSLVSWPMLALVAKSVNARNRAAAMGIVMGGSSLGGIIWPIAIDQMLKNPKLGFPWTMRIVGFVMIPLFAVPCTVVILPSPVPSSPSPVESHHIATSGSDTEGHTPKDSRSIPKELSDDAAREKLPPRNASMKNQAIALFKKPAMACLCLGLFFTYFGMFSPFFYTTSYAISKGFSSTLAFYTISIVNGSSFFGRVIPGVLADKYGRFNLIILANICAAITAMCWTKVTSVAGLVIWAAAYGFASGGILSLQQACAAQVATPTTMGLAIGSVVGATALSAMANIPISGALVAKHGWLSIALFSGVSLLLGSVFLIVARLSQDRNFLAVV
ncbi:uncharacterized protein N7469_000104 [Penicillium citrinum]|uniref:Major facilitator superfamily (MFS) profile domain-containing protein n=1 Tax=Penicillium citrinum TaxID=5077 RepID=A0A9W9TUE3_PENCI|nr:uncharacterized protein N7469_000104 [Penicillium citrinum]KAJ5241777.1 hypothetical protein N7469_000104 [Penicillium citrinum]